LTSGKLVRNFRTNQFSIAVKIDGYTKDLWLGIIEFCSKDLSVNELRKIYDDCNKQLKSMNPDDIPLNFTEMIRELQQTLINRKAWRKS